MLIDPAVLASDFSAAAASVVPGWPCPIRTELLRAPHRHPPLPVGSAAVYVFALGERVGAGAPAGAGTVLKVGRVGVSSGPRFSYQHYGFGAPSTLARSLIKYQVLWPWLGISDLGEHNVQDWMLNNLDRAHFFIPGGYAEVLASLEVYVRARVGSVFEGSA